ncbi:YdbH domain-containing protein [Shewanella yunxiaonensis]|uniref:YdbH domain-containing protein n=1 Tax=Shewanella yunxiaonensis TaxID=2829809 RepID=A0ABX7YY37_9GAMM|nr:YdbH domain-containing protein [Shewanella yunxiaonensis]QUN07235.1 YdbH domain-containing protein [Shewanella yunxiaonensis]
MSNHKRIIYRSLTLMLACLILLSMLLAGGWWLLTQKQSWWLPRINQLLQAKGLQITELSWQIPDWNSLILPHLTIEYRGSQLQFEQLQLQLKQPITWSTLWQWYRSPEANEALGSQQWWLANLQSVSYQHAHLQLTPKLLLPADDNSALTFPITQTLPDISLNDTDIAFIHSAPNGFKLRLPQLKLTRNGKFSSAVQWQQQAQWRQLLALNGELFAELKTAPGASQHGWLAQLQLAPAQLLLALQQLANDSNANELQTAYPWLNEAFLQKLPRVTGTWQTNIQLGLQRGDSLVSVCWSNPALELPTTVGSPIELTPQATTPECPANSVAATLRADDNQQRLALSPLRLALQTSATQRQSLAQWIDSLTGTTQMTNSANAMESRLSQLSAALKQTNTQPNAGITLNLAEGATIDIANKQLAIPVVTLTPTVANAHDWLTLELRQLNLTPTDTKPVDVVVKTTDKFQLELQRLLQQLPALQLQTQWQLRLNLPQGIDWQQSDLAINSQNTQANFAGNLVLDGNNQSLSMLVNPNASVQSQALLVKRADELALTVASIHSQITSPLQFSLTPEQLQLQLPELQQQLQSVNMTTDNIQASMGRMDITLPGLPQQQWHWTESDVLTQLQTLNVKQHLSLASERIHVSQRHLTRMGSRTDTLLNLSKASLVAQWLWDGQELSSEEQWQFDRLKLTSQHQLRPYLTNAGPPGYDVSGHWQMQALLADIRTLAAKNLVLSTDWQLQGKTAITADIALRQRGTALTLSGTIQPQLVDGTGSYQQLPFEGLQASSRCRFVVDKAASQAATAAVNCQQLAIQIAAFNPGVLMDNVTIKGDLSFVPELDAQKRQRAGNWLLPGFNDADIQLAANADMLGGQLALPRFRLRLNQPSDAYLMLLGLDLHQLLQANPQPGIDATGIFDGVLPLAITDNQLSVSGGHLASRAPGGVIQVGANPAVQQMRQSQPYLDFVFSTLEELHYREITSTFDMAPDGEAKLNMAVKGRGKGVERPIELNYSHEENLLQLLRSLSIGDRLQMQLEASMQ